jgi:general stress protein YciG
MAGTKQGGQQTRETNYKRHGKDFYKKIGAIGGKKGGMKGFALNPKLASEAGKIGGSRGKRGKSKLTA